MLRRLRERMPSLLRRAKLADARVAYAGDTPLVDETVTSIRGDALRVGLVVVLVNLVLLALFLRAVARAALPARCERARRRRRARRDDVDHADAARTTTT